MRFQCSYCKAVLDIDDGVPGELVACGQCNATVAVPMGLTAPGSMLGDFAIVREIGIGGMGRVYLAHQVSLDRPVALKILSESFANDASFIESFIKEARTAAALNHPNIVQAYAVNCDSGCYYFAMELVDGNTMKQVIQSSGRLVHEKVLAIARDILGALAYAWEEKKLIHRDIKPDNIMLTTDGRTKLADLGLARKVTEINEDGSSELYGTPQYIAPELLLNFPADIRSDIYSMGATMYHALTGAYPYTAADANSMAMEHLYTPLRPISSLAPDVPAPLACLVEIMLSKRPDHRYADYKYLLADLQRVQKGEPPMIPLSPNSQLPINTDLPAAQSFSIAEADLQAAAGSKAAAAGKSSGGLQFGKKDGGRLVLGGKEISGSSALHLSPSGTGAVKLPGATSGGGVSASTTQPALRQQSEKKANKRSPLLVLGAVAAALLLVALGAWAFFATKDPPKPEQAPAAGESSATPIEAALQKLPSESEKLAFLRGEAIKQSVGSAGYESFVNLAAPLIEPALRNMRERVKEEAQTEWKNLQARFEQERKEQAEADRLQAEREEKAAAEKKEKQRQERLAAEKARQYALKQQEMRNNMVTQAQELDFSGARQVFAVMVESSEEDESAWAKMWLDSLQDAEQLYQLLRNSKEKLAGVIFKIRDERRVQRDWRVSSVIFDTVKVARVPTEREKDAKNPEPQPELTFELGSIPPAYFILLAQKALELDKRIDEFDRMFGNFLLVRGFHQARSWLDKAMVSERLLNEIPGIRLAHVKTRLQAMQKMSVARAEQEVALLKRNYAEEFEAVAEKVNALLEEKKAAE
jgi:serine/threonine protein kinase